MKRLLYCAAAIMLCGCHESLEERAQREAREYTAKYCPTPEQNHTRTDSVTFDIESRTYHYYCSVTGDLDDQKVFDENNKKIADLLLNSVKENTGFKAYKAEGFSFRWTLRSDKDKKTVYFDKRFTPKDYNSPSITK